MTVRTYVKVDNLKALTSMESIDVWGITRQYTYSLSEGLVSESNRNSLILNVLFRVIRHSDRYRNFYQKLSLRCNSQLTRGLFNTRVQSTFNF